MSLVSDEHRFAEAYERCAPAIRAYFARRTSGDRVDDAVADTFLVAWRRIDEVPPGREGLLWLYRVASYVLSHEWRSAGRRARLSERLTSLRPNGIDSPEERAVADDECRRVLEAIGRLGPEDAELLKLVAWEGLSTAEVAVVLELSANAASQRISRARKKLTDEYDRRSATTWQRPVGHSHAVDAARDRWTPAREEA